MSAEKKSGILTSWEQSQYDDIILKAPLQRQHYITYLAQLGEKGKRDIVKRCERIGFNIDFETGQLHYGSNFIPLQLSYDLWFVRHGKTEGNTEPRVYQAEDAAAKMEHEVQTNNWLPDLIVYSPLRRAQQTGEAFARKHLDIPTTVCHGITEMAFGDWDNVRVIDVPHDSMGHLFYLEQNALVVASRPHVVHKGAMGEHKEGATIFPESFIDVLERLHGALCGLEKEEAVKSITGRRPNILMYGHSMAGAAITMLLGHGKLIEGSMKSLGFDGKYIMPNATPTHLLPKKP